MQARRLRDEYRKLGIVDVQVGKTGLEIEFSKLQSSIRVNFIRTHSTLPSNKPKNRYADMEMLPCELLTNAAIISRHNNDNVCLQMTKPV